MIEPTVYGGYTRRALDEQYDNVSRWQGDFQQLVADWLARSAAAVATWRTNGVSVHDNIAYGDGDRETLTIFTPPNVTVHVGETAPVLIFFHGGYWRAMSKDHFAFVAAPALAAGALAVLVNYPLIPQVTMSGLVDACLRAVRWLLVNVAAYGGDNKRVVVSGHSAGGHIAALCAAHDFSPYAIRGAVAMSGLFDLAPIAAGALNDVLQLQTEDVQTFSPVHKQPRVPLYALVGADESDEYHRQSLTLCDVWRRHVSVAYDSVPNCEHFGILDRLADVNDVYARLWLQRCRAYR